MISRSVLVAAIRPAYPGRLRAVVSAPAARAGFLQGEVHAECRVRLADDGSRQPAHALADALDRYRPDLLGLGLRVTRKPGLTGGEQNLKWVNTGNVRGHRHHCDHSAAQPGRRGIGSIVTDDYGRAGFTLFVAEEWVLLDDEQSATGQLAAQAEVDAVLPEP